MENIGKQFVGLHKTVVERLLALEEEVKSLKISHENDKKELIESMPNLDKVLDSIRGKDGENGYIPIKDTDYFDGKDGQDGKDGKNGKNGKAGINGKDGFTPTKGIDYFDGEKGEKGDAGDIKDLSPDEIRDSLTSLQEDDRLDVKAIKGLDKFVEDKIPKTYPNAIAYTRGAVKAYDLSPKLDGVTLTYSLPAFWRIISVHLSSTPNILQPTTDYTVDGSNMQITFTSQINAATSLAAGQTCIIVYAEGAGGA